MTNNEIIFENVRASFTPAQLAELVQSHLHRRADLRPPLQRHDHR